MKFRKSNEILKHHHELPETTCELKQSNCDCFLPASQHLVWVPNSCYVGQETFCPESHWGQRLPINIRKHFEGSKATP